MYNHLFIIYLIDDNLGEIHPSVDSLDGAKDDPKTDTSDDPIDDTNNDSKDDPNNDTKNDANDDPKDDPNDDTKNDSNDDPKPKGMHNHYHYQSNSCTIF